MIQNNITTHDQRENVKKPPLVSIVTATHNRSDLLQRALSSLLKQTYPNIEIIIVDDGSVDDTQEVLKHYADPRIILLKNDTPMGACHARNRGIYSATGKFITFLDDDDEFLPDRIKEMVKAWDEKWAYIATGYKYVTKTKASDRIPSEIITLDDLLFKINTGNSVLTTRERIITLGGFDETLASSQDYDMWVRLSRQYGDGYCVQKVLFTMHTEHEKPRITMSKKKFRGHHNFYKKHQDIMSYEQKKSKLFELVKYKNRQISLVKLLNLGHKRPKEAIKFYLGQRFPKLKKHFFSLQEKKSKRKKY